MENQFTISAIIIIIGLIFPGLVFKRFYYQGQFTKQFGSGLFADRLITSIFWGVVVQTISFPLFSRGLHFTYTGIKPKIQEVYEKVQLNKMPDIPYQYLGHILEYLIFSIFIGTVLGILLHKFIRFFKIDLYIEVFRFSNHWNYILNGEIFYNKKLRKLPKGRYKETIIDVVVCDQSEKSKMLSGYLTDYTISRTTGELETIYLTGTSRYSQSQKQFKPIPGQLFVIKYSNVTDLNIRYIYDLGNSQITWMQLRRAFLAIFFPIGCIFIFSVPWNLNLDLNKSIVGIFYSLTSWLQISTIILGLLKGKYKGKKDFILLGVQIVFVIAFALLALRIFIL